MPGQARNEPTLLRIAMLVEGMGRAVAHIDKESAADLRRVMQGMLARDLETAGDCLAAFEAQIGRIRAQVEDLELQLARLRARDGSPIEPDDERDRPAHRPPNLSTAAADLWEAGLSVRAANRLAGAGITTLPQLVNAELDSLRTVKGLGTGCLAEIGRLKDIVGRRASR